MSELPEFPVFRKYLNNSSFFKVLSPNHFEELKKLPRGYSLFIYKVKILPDRNFIFDMLYNYQLHWEVIEEEEYEKIKSNIKS